MQQKFVLTADIDWASDYCIQAFIDYAASHEIVPTLFVTHRSRVVEQAAADGKVDLGIHPTALVAGHSLRIGAHVPLVARDVELGGH